MKGPVGKIAHSIEMLNGVLGRISYFLIVAEAGFIVFSVFMRYVLNSPFKAATDISQIIMVYVAFLGCAFVLRIEGHIYVEIFVNLLNRRIRNVIMGINYLILGIPYCIVLFYYTFFFVESSYKITERTIGSGILIWPVKGTMLLGFTLLGIQFLIMGIEMIHRGLVTDERTSRRNDLA